MNPTLSIIVPIYCVEDYLEECVDSILNQPYRDFELILVDDGSPDKCGEICDAYFLKDGRVRVIHKENGGLSSARNAGIEIAKGNYLSFIDSDDFISDDYYQENMQYLLTHPSVDMVVMQVCHFDRKSNIVKENIKKDINNHIDSVGYLLSIDYICSAWINIYKREIFNCIRFPNGQIFEDGYILPDIAEAINNLYLSDIGIYYYRVRNESIMTKKRTEKCWHDILISHIKILDYCYKYPDNKKRFIERYKGFSLSLIYAMLEYPNGNFKIFIKKFQNFDYSFMQLLNSNISIKDFIKLYVLKKTGYKFFVKTYKLFNIY